MSALTKIFVVLLVVMSLLLSAALIVFVNRQENFKVIAENALKDRAVADANARIQAEEVDKIKNIMTAQAADLNQQIADAKKDTKVWQQKADDAQKPIPALNSQITQLTAQNASTAQALTVAEAHTKDLADQIVALRGQNDDLAKKFIENNNRISELTSSLETTQRHDRFMGEQNASLAQDNTRMAEILRKLNVSPTGTNLPAGGALNTTPSVNINGIVRDFQNINGVPFATISLGSADAVTRGMKFNVIDPAHGNFLGYLIVDSVNAHDATGRLEGPRVKEVRPNVSEVKTQLQ